MSDNPTAERQLVLLRANVERIRKRATALSDALHTPQAADWPADVRALLRDSLSTFHALLDIHGLNAAPDRATMFWSKVTRPESNAVGLGAPCWPADYARLGKKRDGIAVAHWQGKMRPVSHVAFELEYGRPLEPDERLRRDCQTKHCANVRQHYTIVHKRLKRAPLDEPLLEILDEARTTLPLCRNGHHLEPGALARNCSQCRTERRARTQEAKNAAWRAAYYGDTSANTNGTARAGSDFEGVEPATETPGDARFDDLESAISAMFEPIPA